MNKFLKFDLHFLFLPLSIFLISAIILIGKDNLTILQLAAISIILYILLSLIHHLKDKSLTLEIILEYILLACLVLVVLTGNVI